MGVLLTGWWPSARAARAAAWWGTAAETGLLAAVAFAVLGWHPWAEDGGLYLQGVEAALDPHLFEASREFVAPQLRYSAFARLMVWVCRGLHLPLMSAVLLVKVTSLAGLLLAVRWLAAICWKGETERRWGVLLTALWLGLPVAGTSLTIADPYLTARSLALPCAVVALAGSLEYVRDRHARMLAVVALGLLGAAAMHVLVAVCGGVLCGGVLLQAGAGTSRERVWRWAGGLAGLLSAAGIAVCRAGAETEAARMAALSRSYWFLGRWRWFELVGLLAPVVVVSGMARWQRRWALRELAWGCGGTTAAAVLLCAAFAREGVASYTLARLQPMRVLQMVYVVMLVALGGWVGRALRWQRGWVQAMVAGLLAAPLVVAAGGTFRASPRFETGRGNAWADAFVWVREHTPPNAVVALDADYIAVPGEEAQNFRALAERSSLPDWSKDGGEAAIAPELAEAWRRGVALQTGLSRVTDAERRRRLLPAGVSWVVLQEGAETALPCPFRNTAVMVCALR